MQAKPWYPFLRLNDGQWREVLPLRALNSIEECNRCFIPTQITSELDMKLTSYVCKSCHLDDQEWDYSKKTSGISITIQSMIMESPLKTYVEGEDSN